MTRSCYWTARGLLASWFARIPRPAASFSLNILVLIVLAAAAFDRPTERLFNGFDGLGFKLMFQQLAPWSNLALGLQTNPFQGLGGLYFLNVWLLPTANIVKLGGEGWGVVAAYSFAAFELFVATWLLGRALGHSRVVSLTGGWVIAVAATPFFEFAQIDPQINISPHWADEIAIHAVAIALFSLALRGSLLRRVAAAIVLAAVAVWSLAAHPTFLILPTPVAAFMAVGILLAVPRAEGRIKRAAIALAPLAVVLAAGGLIYFFGIMTYTASAMFTAELNQTTPRIASLTSLIFQYRVHGWLGPALAGLAAVGLLRDLCNSDTRGRARVALLGLIPLCAIIALFFLTSGSWTLPIPLYFEFVLWPIYAIYAAEVLVWVAHSFSSLFRANLRRVAPAMVLVAILLLRFQPIISRNDGFGHRPVPNNVTTVLENSIALRSPGPFKGYAATFAGYGGPSGPPADWITQIIHDDKLVRATGTTMRMTYLWHHYIPTLEEYSPLTSPPFYAVTSRLLSRPPDRQTRNVLMLSYPNIPLLQSMGVRFVVSDEILAAPAAERASVSISDVLPIRLYELADPNRGDYSPTSVVTVESAAGALAAMARPDFDFRHKVVLFESAPATLVSATRAILSVAADGYLMEAESPGTSLLLLPVQYSRCLESLDVVGKAPRLLRANLAQVAVVFEGSVRYRLRNAGGVVGHSWCRLEDTRDVVKFKIQDIERTYVARR